MSSFSKFLYSGIYKWMRMPVGQLLSEFESLEHLSRDELRAYQWRKLIELLRYAVEHSPYYKNMFDQIGANLEDIRSEDDLQLIPILTKRDIKKYANEILVTANKKNLFMAKTSGSTGIPLKFYKDPIGLASTYASMYQGHRWWGVDIGEREARLWGGTSGVKAQIKIKSIDFLLNRFRQKTLEVNDKIFSDFIKNIVRKKPSYLMGYPSYLFLFARYIKDKGLYGRDLHLSFIKFTAESSGKEQREIIEEVFGCPCVSEYGSAETGVISFECPSRNNHVMIGSVLVEFSRGKFCTSENYNDIIVTNLYNYAFPVIRYALGDIVSPIEGTCPCGRQFPLLSNVIGRTHDLFTGKSGKQYHSSIFSGIMKKLVGIENGLDLCRFVQKQKGCIEVQIVADDRIISSRSLTGIINLLITEFRGDVDVECKIVHNLPRDTSGKFRYFVSELKNQ